MWERIRVIIRKELIQALREPRMRTLLFLPPLIQLLVFGFAVNMDVDHVRIAWMDMDRTPLSRDLRAAFEGSGRFDVVAQPANEEQAGSALDRGAAQAVVRVLPEFERNVRRGRPTEVQVLVDGTDSNTASLVSEYAGQVIANYSSKVMPLTQNVRVLARNPSGPPSTGAPQVVPVTRVWFNPDLYSRNYFVPGVVANIVLIITLMLTALAIVREKEIGTMEQLMVTPIRPIELMLGKTLPFAVIGLLEVFMITGAALLIFHIPFRGSPLLLFACSILFLMTSLGAGLFLSTVSQTQQQAMMMNFFFSTP
ncbi:MAG TPA: ABC transporter permease, partial [Bryobacteraceae bacterium]|nr:ABC transporter permease [Bryobacteraceae bacterium]